MKVCSISECGRAVRARGLCNAHYTRSLSGTPLDSPIRQRKNADGTLPTVDCAVDGCDRPKKSQVYCSTHEYQHQNGRVPGEVRTPTPGEWGKWFVGSDGYVVRSRTLDGIVERQLEHRHVMEQVLGRSLLPHENVHHLNGQRSDNRLDNLELWSTSQPAGQRVEDKTEWALAWLLQYAPEKLRDTRSKRR